MELFGVCVDFIWGWIINHNYTIFSLQFHLLQHFHFQCRCHQISLFFLAVMDKVESLVLFTPQCTPQRSIHSKNSGEAVCTIFLDFCKVQVVFLNNELAAFRIHASIKWLKRRSSLPGFHGSETDGVEHCKRHVAFANCPETNSIQIHS